MIEWMLTVVAELIARPGREAEVTAELLRMVEATRKEEGCIQYDLHVSTEQPGSFVFYENWSSRDALARHEASPHLQEFGKKADELLSQAPRVLTYKRIA